MLRREDFIEIQKLHHDGWEHYGDRTAVKHRSQDSTEVPGGSAAGVRAQAEELEG
jgi:hypothetical protein